MFGSIDTQLRRRAGVALVLMTTIGAGAWAATAWAGAHDRATQLLTGYEIVTVSTETNGFRVKSASARCPRAKKVLGGGASILGSSDAAIFWNGPARVTGAGSWTAAASRSTTTARPWSLEVYAVCADATST